MQLEHFRQIANDYALEQYFIGLNDMCIDDQDVQDWFNAGDAPHEMVIHYADKRGLDNKFELGFIN